MTHLLPGRRRRSGATATAAALAVGLVLLAAVPASAALAPPTPAVPGAASDPNVITCTDPVTGAPGYCMYTDSDLGGSGYPSNRIRVFFSTDGRSWADEGNALTEDEIGLTGNNHLWASSVDTGVNGWGETEYRLYVTEVINGQTMVLGYASTFPYGFFGQSPLGQLSGGTPFMADPSVFVDRDSGGHYMLWNDGEMSTCSGVSMGFMTSPNTVVNPSRITFDSTFEYPYTCGAVTQPPNPSIVKPRGTPYIYDASLYDMSGFRVAHPAPGRYLLVFSAVLQSSVNFFDPRGLNSQDPGGCAAKGQTTGHNSFLAYAWSTSLSGPFHWGGTLMCPGSEWTNHASLTEVPAANGQWRLMLSYHGLPSGGSQRTVHTDCAFSMNSQFLTVHRSPEGTAWCLNSASVYALRSRSTGKFVTADPDRSKYLYASSDVVGIYEEFGISFNGGLATLNARSTQQFVSADQNQGGKVVASRAGAGGWETFTVERNGDGTVSLVSHNANGSLGKHVTATTSNPQLYATVPLSTAIKDNEKFDLILLEN